MMMPGRVPDHVFGGTVFLASPTGPLPHTEQRFSLQRREARPSRFLPKERCSLVTHEEAKKNFYLEELKLFLVKGSVGRPHARTASPRVRSLRVPAREWINMVMIIIKTMMIIILTRSNLLIDIIINQDLCWKSDNNCTRSAINQRSLNFFSQLLRQLKKVVSKVSGILMQSKSLFSWS